MVAGTSFPSNSTLTNNEQSALFFQHKAAYERAKAVADKARLELANVGKKARADLGEFAVDQIKLAIKMGNDESAKKERARIDREAMTLRWLGLPIGSQGSLFEPDRRTAEDKAQEEGFAAGSDKNTPRTPPEKYGLTTESARRWYKGFDDAQDAIFSAFEKKGSPLLRGAEPAAKAEQQAEEAQNEADEGDETNSEDAPEGESVH